jgi:hypothetical protein
MSKEPIDMHAVDLESLPIEQLLAANDEFVLRLLNAFLSKERIKELMEENMARTAALAMCIRFVESMQVMSDKVLTVYDQKARLHDMMGLPPPNKEDLKW